MCVCVSVCVCLCLFVCVCVYVCVCVCKLIYSVNPDKIFSINYLEVIIPPALTIPSFSEDYACKDS